MIAEIVAIALAALCNLLPNPPRYLLSDNGSEFMGHFHKRLQHYNIAHWWTYPRSPKMNPHAERFNRTIQEQFIDYHEDLLFTDLTAFNQKLTEWLIAYNINQSAKGIGLIHSIDSIRGKCYHYIHSTYSKRKCKQAMKSGKKEPNSRFLFFCLFWSRPCWPSPESAVTDC